MSVKLTDLEPRWLDPNLFAFKCPCCRAWWITVKTVPMTHGEQASICDKEFGDYWNLKCILSRDAFGWTINGRDFASLTVTPSIDASAAGHWHGHITDGEIR